MLPFSFRWNDFLLSRVSRLYVALRRWRSHGVTIAEQDLCDVIKKALIDEAVGAEQLAGGAGNPCNLRVVSVRH